MSEGNQPPHIAAELAARLEKYANHTTSCLAEASNPAWTGKCNCDVESALKGSAASLSAHDAALVKPLVEALRQARLLVGSSQFYYYENRNLHGQLQELLDAALTTHEKRMGGESTITPSPTPEKRSEFTRQALVDYYGEDDPEYFRLVQPGGEKHGSCTRETRSRGQLDQEVSQMIWEPKNSIGIIEDAEVTVEPLDTALCPRVVRSVRPTFHCDPDAAEI